MTELWALMDGLVLARNKNVSNLCVELDALAVIHLLKISNANCSLEPLLADCRDMLKSFQDATQ